MVGVTRVYPADIYLLQVNNRNTSVSVVNLEPVHDQWRRSGVFIVNFEHISRLILVSLLLILNMLFADWVLASFSIGIIA